MTTTVGLVCMFCNQAIQDDESYIDSPFHDGTESHTSCGDAAIKRIFEDRGMTDL